jgi:uncharacterized protein involved in exopolysaccharide biosynthesis
MSVEIRPPQPRGEAGVDLFDYALARAYLSFGVRSLRRHWVLAFNTFALVVASAVVALVVMPRTYHTEVKILTSRNQVMPALGNPGRAVPRDSDAPTQAASELVLRRENLISLTKQTNLLDQWDQTRAPILKAKDWLMRSIEGPPREEDRLEALVGLLEKRLKVTTEEGTVTIELDWPDPQMAYQLVEAAQLNFIETRHTLEVSTITEAISILEWHASAMRDTVQGTLEELRKSREAVKAESAPVAPGSVRTVARRVEGRPHVPRDQELDQTKAMLAAKRRALTDLEDYRRKRQAELQAQLAEQTATYAPAHPLVVASRDSIAALSRESPQVESLKKEAAQLEAEVARRELLQASEADKPDERAARPDVLLEARREISSSLKEVGLVRPEDDSVEYLKAQLKMSIDKYQDLLGRIDGATIELDTARAAFKYRYSVVRPAQVPKKPDKPKAEVVLGGGIMAAALLAMFAAVAADLRAGRIVEAWQVERLLGIPVLAEIERA